MTILKSGRPSQQEKAIAQLKEKKEENKQTSLLIPKVLWKKIKQYAANKEIPIKLIIIKALEEYLDKHPDENSKNSLDD